MRGNAGKSDIPRTIVQEVVIPAREYLALAIKKGQILRFTDVEGHQVPDVIAFNSNDLEEKSSCQATRLANRTWHITQGHCIYSQKCNKMFTIIEDTVGVHSFWGGYCNEYTNYFRYGVKGERNCQDNLAMAIAPYGLTKKDFCENTCFCLFMNLLVGADGAYEIREAPSEPGDHIDLRAEMDCLVAISNCPQERNPCNAFNPTPMKVIVYESA